MVCKSESFPFFLLCRTTTITQTKKTERESERANEGRKEGNWSRACEQADMVCYAILCGAIWHGRTKQVQVGQGLGLKSKSFYFFMPHTHNQSKKEACLCFLPCCKNLFDSMWPN